MKNVGGRVDFPKQQVCVADEDCVKPTGQQGSVATGGLSWPIQRWSAASLVWETLATSHTVSFTPSKTYRYCMTSCEAAPVPSFDRLHIEFHCACLSRGLSQLHYLTLTVSC